MVLAETAASGLCNPEDDTPVLDGPPTEDAARRDTRSNARRNHHGLNAGYETSHSQLSEGDGRGLHGLVPAAAQPPTDSCARYFLP